MMKKMLILGFSVCSPLISSCLFARSEPVLAEQDSSYRVGVQDGFVLGYQAGLRSSREENSVPQFYLKGGAEYIFSSRDDVFDPDYFDLLPSEEAKSDISGGYGLFLGAGYDLGKYRVDMEVFIGQEDFEVLPTSVSAEGDQFGVMLNLFYDTPFYREIDFVLGAGIGYERASYKVFDSGKTEEKETVTGLVFRPHLGVAYPIAQNMITSLSLKYAMPLNNDRVIMQRASFNLELRYLF